MKQKINKIIELICLIIISVLIVSSVYYKYNFSTQEFDELVFYIYNGAQYTSNSVVNSFIKSCIIPVIFLVMVFYLLGNNIEQFKKTINFKIKHKDLKITYPIKFIYEHKKIYIAILFLISIVLFFNEFKIFNYIYNKTQTTNIYEEYYVDGNNVNITFPEEKRNLILIVCESMESTLFSKENGGSWEYSIIPELEELAENNINFSNTNNLGGALTLHGTTFTAGGLVAETAGIPLITASSLKNSNEYKGNGTYFNGAYTLGNILQKEEYNLEIMMGSEGTFGGRTQYFVTNGNYKVFDLNYAIEIGKMDVQDTVWWGFDDDTLFKWSKEEILNLASEDKPFNYIMLTADTHFVDGYLSENVEEKFDTQYENVFAYSSKSISEFVKWIQKQEFYENTTIVILGDHLGMQDDFYREHVDENYQRGVYNVIINSAIQAQNTKNRQFTTIDMYPTIIASLGAVIDGNKLGFGTNLYSDEKTLVEILGSEYVNNELRKNSKYYNNEILGEDYYFIKAREFAAELFNTN